MHNANVSSVSVQCRRGGAGSIWRSLRGSVLMIVLVTVMFATVALIAFIERASNDLLVEARDVDADRLRQEALSALETTLAVLEDFRLVNGSLRSPAEGWSDPLEFAGYEPEEGRTVEILFIDESGKFSLPNASQTTFLNLFKAWELSPGDAEKLTDALLGWMKKDHVPASASAPQASDYERGAIPFGPPGRPLRSFSELATIGFARDVFYDEYGQPTELYDRFVDAFSLYDFKEPNVNGAGPELLAGLGITDTSQQKRLEEYLKGGGPYERRGPGFFRSGQEVGTILGAQSPAAELASEIRALRIILTVREGRSSYRLNVLIAPPGGAEIPKPAVPTPQPAEGEKEPPAAPTASAPAAANAKKLNYPFTLLEFRENDAIPSSPAPDTL